MQKHLSVITPVAGIGFADSEALQAEPLEVPRPRIEQLPV
jgi:hypothetical protein